MSVAKITKYKKDCPTLFTFLRSTASESFRLFFIYATVVFFNLNILVTKYIPLIISETYNASLNNNCF